MASATVRSDNEAVLHLATGGKVVRLPFKEGDRVSKGQVIAALDSYAIQKQLEAALNTYRIARNTFDQTQTNATDNVLKAQQTYPSDVYAKAGLGGEAKDVALNDVVKRIVDGNQANLDNSVIQVQLANNAFTLSSISAPFDGTLIQQDVPSVGVFASPSNSFTIIDPHALVLRANISDTDIRYVAVGQSATIRLSGNDTPFDGVITKVYPNKVTLPTGEQVFQIDIAAKDLARLGSYKQTGTVLIHTAQSQAFPLVPAWLVLSNKYIWVMQEGKPVLREVTVGDTVGDKKQLVQGLNANDELIVDPAFIANTTQ